VMVSLNNKPDHGYFIVMYDASTRFTKEQVQQLLDTKVSIYFFEQDASILSRFSLHAVAEGVYTNSILWRKWLNSWITYFPEVTEASGYIFEEPTPLMKKLLARNEELPIELVKGEIPKRGTPEAYMTETIADAERLYVQGKRKIYLTLIGGYYHRYRMSPPMRGIVHLQARQIYRSFEEEVWQVMAKVENIVLERGKCVEGSYIDYVYPFSDPSTQMVEVNGKKYSFSFGKGEANEYGQGLKVGCPTPTTLLWSLKSKMTLQRLVGREYDFTEMAQSVVAVLGGGDVQEIKDHIRTIMNTKDIVFYPSDVACGLAAGGNLFECVKQGRKSGSMSFDWDVPSKSCTGYMKAVPTTPAERNERVQEMETDPVRMILRSLMMEFATQGEKFPGDMARKVLCARIMATRLDEEQPTNRVVITEVASKKPKGRR